MSIVEIKQLHKYYEHLSGKSFLKKKIKQHVLKGLDLKVGKGEIVGIVGESGSGKSTLAHIMMGLIPFEKGRVNLFGQDISDMTKLQKKDLRKKVQFILQNPYESFNLLQRIDKSLLDPLFANGIISNKSEGLALIHEMFRLFRLDPSHLDKMPTELSGGELQRVAIVRGMVLKPECLICDEVISALDVSLQIEVLNGIVQYVRGTNQSCIFITHNIATLKNYADRIVVMKDGEIIEEGRCEQIIFNPQLNYTKKLIQGIPKWRL